MRKMLLLAFALTLAGVTSAQRIITLDPPIKERKWLLEAGVSGYFPGQGLGSSGMTFSVGYFVSPSSFIAYEFGGYFTHTRLETFAYEEYNRGTYVQTHYDGYMNRNYITTPAGLSWNYVFDLSDRVHLCIGPSLGVLSIAAIDFYYPDIDNVPSLRYERDSALTFGANLGIMWNITKRVTLNCGYKITGNTGLYIDYKKINYVTHQLQATVGFRI